MGWSINNNTNRMQMVTSIGQLYEVLGNSMARLSSGLRINSAADDPAGLVISEQLRSQIASLNQELENTNALIHYYETAESFALGIRQKLAEMRELAVGAANEGVNSAEMQEAYNAAAEHLVEEINRVAENAEYNGSRLFDGSEGSVGEISTLEGIDLTSSEAAVESITLIDEALAEIDALQVDLGATQANELESHRRTLQIQVQNLTAAESQLRDTDFVAEYSSMLGDQIRLQASISLLSHSFEAQETMLKVLGS
ncbi:MAG TPA: flagellin [candidate division Zixibacteria bacterium]|nr:flagellin [candidate division Zixibacteria bacterium]